jgi:TrmH family RNA methyltransferase
LPDPPKLDRLYVVLVATRNPLNIGAAARAMSNFGFHHLRVVNPYEASFREARSAVGASELLANAEEFSSVAEAVGDCSLVIGTTAARDRQPDHPLRSLPQGTRLLRKHLSSGRVAILFGSEKRGLSNEDFSHCHWLMRIPTREGHSSMNLGQAVAVCLYELIRSDKADAPAARPKLANSAEISRISATLLESLQLSGYVKPGTAKSTDEKIRRLLRRLHLQSEDSVVLLGMLRKILWKMNHHGHSS